MKNVVEGDSCEDGFEFGMTIEIEFQFMRGSGGKFKNATSQFTFRLQLQRLRRILSGDDLSFAFF